MNICIIGGSGFIGGYLINILKADHNLLNIDKVGSSIHQDVEFRQCDVRSYEELKTSLQPNTDVVVLLAAEHKDDVTPSSKYYDVNVRGTENVLKVMAEKNIPNMVFTSSVAVYGLNKEMPDEFSPTDPFNHYGKSKLQGEDVLRNWYNNNPDRRSLIVIRPTVVFGPGNRGNVYNLLSQISSGRFIMIGNGSNRKSMAYVENIAGFIAHCVNLNLKKYQLYNYIDKPDLSTQELVSQAEIAIGKKILPAKIPYWMGYSVAKVLDVVLGIVGKKNPISAVRIKKFCATTQFDSVCIRPLAYSAPFTLQKGLEITIKSIMEERNAAVKTPTTPVMQAEA